MYYARNPVRLTFEDADWGTLTDDEESGPEQTLSSRSPVPTKTVIRPEPAEMSTCDLQSFGKPLDSALRTATEVNRCEEKSTTDQRQRPTPGEPIWTDPPNQVDQVTSLAPAALPVVTHKDVPHPAQVSRSKVKPLYVVDTNERRQSVPRAAFTFPKDATRSLPPAFSDSDDECDDPLATHLTIGGQPRKQNGDLRPSSGDVHGATPIAILEGSGRC